ncbi:MetQ/NlpA family ABC transporter substrate-binding protein [Criibacterium bergeronii]|uniref:Lipoprotein n=1 Tax=Criibacterium bergeronii TaxID=1871336 RepID=A0A371IJA5_9FIRM|nr:MetQ/NlpA family ABC transporter substrate-binding protein [Criibacterium bergeronii]MBS6063125.1 MetQ/NlpA family lipoprotein [Peptostreptococcaceae bacterium]RDY20556.1 MetQ/NlpA family lipoprotein [Criibacterium bergeronii]
MKKNLIKVFTLALVSALTLAACSGGADNKPAQGDAAKTTEKSNKVLKIGASPQPHAAILENIKQDLADKGIELEIQQFSDYVVPNTAVEDGDLDANFFQHVPYMDEFNKQQGTHLVSVGSVHLEPMGLYSKKIKDLKELKEGATISIPNDPTNGGRALLLLEKNGIIKLKDGAGLAATDKDIVENPMNLKITLLDAAQLPRTLEDVDASVINTNFALEADLNPLNDALVIEGKDSPYANIVAVKEGNEKDERVVALMEALNSEKTKKFIEDEYKGAIVPAF